MIQIDPSKTIDPRSGFDLFRRKELEVICKKERVNITPGMPASSMRLLLNNAGVSPRKYRPQHFGPLHSDHNTTYYYEKDPKPVKVKMEVENAYLDRMKRRELMEYLRGRGIKFRLNDKKDVLLKKAQDFMNGAHIT